MEPFDINNVLGHFQPIGLKEMDSVKLMNRVDMKYILPADKIPMILSKLNGYYKVLEIDNIRSFSYFTTYLDTDDFLFFNHHMTGRLERHKVRYRRYESTGVTYLEVKMRTNTNRTVKWRIKTENQNGEGFDAASGEFISRHIKLKPDQLKPVLFNNFKRITLVNVGMTERVTIDFNLTFADNNSASAELPYLGIIEIKKEGSAYKSETEKTLREMSVRPTGFSKYCIGAAIFNEIPRKNMLKQKFILINKIKNEYYRSVC